MYGRHLLVVLLVLGWLAVGCGPSGGNPAPLPPPPAPPIAEPAPKHPLDGWVDAYVSAIGHGESSRAFHGEVLVARDDEVLVQRAYHGEPGRRYRVGSVTKPFTAVAVLQLAHKGKLGLDDSVRVHVPELPETYQAVTIAQLLSHRGGLGSYTQDDALMKARGEPHNHEQMLAAITKQPPIAAPGTRWSYSNSGYYLLGLVIERVSAQSYAAYLAEHVFGPAGMTETNTGVDALVSGLTVTGGALVAAHPAHPSVPFAAGAIASTARDLHRFARALQDDTLLPATWREQMWTDRGGPTDTVGWGYGWMLRQREGVPTVGHNGGIDGFTSVFEMTRDGRWVMVALSNVDTIDAADAGEPALRMALTNAPIEPPKPHTFLAFDGALGEALAGSYVLPPATEAKLRDQLGDQLADAVREATVTAEGAYVFKPVGQGPVELKLRDDGLLVNDALRIEITVEGKRDETVQRFRLQQGGLVLTYERAPPAPTSSP